MKNIDMLIQAFKNTFKGPEDIGFTAGIVQNQGYYDPRVTPYVGSKTATEYSTVPIGNQGFSIEDAAVPGTFNNPWDFERTQQVLAHDFIHPLDPEFQHWESVPSPFGNPNLATIDAFNRYDYQDLKNNPMLTSQLYNVPYTHDYMPGWNRVSDDPIARDRGLHVGGGAIRYPSGEWGMKPDIPAGLGYKIGSALAMGNPLLAALMMAPKKK